MIEVVEIALFDVLPATWVYAAGMIICSALDWPLQIAVAAAIIFGGWCEPNVRQECCQESTGSW